MLDNEKHTKGPTNKVVTSSSYSEQEDEFYKDRQIPVTKPVVDKIEKPAVGRVKKVVKQKDDEKRLKLQVTLGSYEYQIDGDKKRANRAPFQGNRDIFIPVEMVESKLEIKKTSEGVYLVTKKGW